MLKFNDSLHHFSISLNEQSKEFWKEVKQHSSPAGQWMIDFAKLEANTWIGRNKAEWSLPWDLKILDRFKMPAYDSTFKKDWTQITDERANEIKKSIQKENKKFCVLYSGGIDSLLITTALLKNLSKEELKNVCFYCNTASVIENPKFYKKYIDGKFVTINSTKYLTEDVIAMGYTIISSMAGDTLCGSRSWGDLHNNLYYYIKELSIASKQNIINHWPMAHNPDVHYTLFKDLIISFYVGLYADGDFNKAKILGEIYYDKIQKNIQTSDVPVHSLFDFFWWNLFNIKYINIAVRTYTHDNFKNDFEYIDKNMLDWYNTVDYQKWSMVNNNNGEKIHIDVNFAQSSLKWCAKKYIYDFDKNDWYLYYKQKLPSGEMQKLREKNHLANNTNTPMTFFAITEKLKPVYLFDEGVKDYVIHHFAKFKKDW
jgi:hypothetical protein